MEWKPSLLLVVLILLGGFPVRIESFQVPILSTTTTTPAVAPKSTKTTTKSNPSPKHDDDNPSSAASIQAIQDKTIQRAKNRHDAATWNALFTHMAERPTPRPVTPISSQNGNSHSQQLPDDFPPGCWLRVAPNGAASDEGWLDGDGMITCITFPPTQPDKRNKDSTASSAETATVGMFSSTYIETTGRQKEAAAAAASRNNHNSNNKSPLPRFKGTLGNVPRGWPLLQNIVSNILQFGTLQAQKDTCNTALVMMMVPDEDSSNDNDNDNDDDDSNDSSSNSRRGRILALMEQCPPTEIAVSQAGRVETVQSNCLLDGAIPVQPITGGALSAHGRTCPTSNQYITASYQSDARPYIRVDTFAGNDWNLQHSVGVDVPTPVMLHDSAITDTYAVILDFPLTIRPRRLLLDQFPVAYEPENGARIGLVPRHPPSSSSSSNSSNNNKEEPIRWFDCEPGVVLHMVNAYETVDDDDKGIPLVVVQGVRSEPDRSGSYLEQFAASFLYEWTLDLQTGQVREERCLNPAVIFEFPQLDPAMNGRQEATHTYGLHCYSVGGGLELHSLPKEGMLLDGVVKLALRDDATRGVKKGDVLDLFQLPDQWYAVSEPTIVPKTGGGGGEYILQIVTHVPKEGTLSWRDFVDGANDSSKSNDDDSSSKSTGTVPKHNNNNNNNNNNNKLHSQVLVLDGEQLQDGPVWSAELPQHVNYGLHSLFVEWDQMKQS